MKMILIFSALSILALSGCLNEPSDGRYILTKIEGNNGVTDAVIRLDKKTGEMKICSFHEKSESKAYIKLTCEDAKITP